MPKYEEFSFPDQTLKKLILSHPNMFREIISGTIVQAFDNGQEFTIKDYLKEQERIQIETNKTTRYLAFEDDFVIIDNNKSFRKFLIKNRDLTEKINRFIHLLGYSDVEMGNDNVLRYIHVIIGNYILKGKLKRLEEKRLKTLKVSLCLVRSATKNERLKELIQYLSSNPKIMKYTEK